MTIDELTDQEQEQALLKEFRQLSPHLKQTIVSHLADLARAGKKVPPPAEHSAEISTPSAEHSTPAA